MYSTLAAIVIVGLVAWLWADSLRARETARRVAKRCCENEGVQFLDDTVALAALRPVLDLGRPRLRRVYEFEFSRVGNDRQRGSVTLTGARLETVYITPLPEEAAASGDGEVVDLASRRMRH